MRLRNSHSVKKLGECQLSKNHANCSFIKRLSKNIDNKYTKPVPIEIGAVEKAHYIHREIHC